MLAITAGAAALVFRDADVVSFGMPAVLVAGACLCWAIDNNLTRVISATDPVTVAAVKGGVAGVVNVAVALGSRAEIPPVSVVVVAGIVGLLGYGTSLALFVRALRDLGTSRTGAYFATAPFIGALGSIVILSEPVTLTLALAAVLMIIGVWLHLTERHDHEHVHDSLTHDHRHEHDEHHQHEHPAGMPVSEPHSHEHTHAPLRHRHPHYPDLHHRHGH